MHTRSLIVVAVAALIVLAGSGATAGATSPIGAICPQLHAYVEAYDWTVRVRPSAEAGDGDLLYFAGLVRADAAHFCGESARNGGALSEQTVRWHFGNASVLLEDYQRRHAPKSFPSDGPVPLPPPTVIGDLPPEPSPAPPCEVRQSGDCGGIVVTPVG